MDDLFLYLKYYEDSIILHLIANKKIIDKDSLDKNKTSDLLLITFKKLIEKNNIQLSDIKRLYLEHKDSTWTANRLVFLFIKTISFALNIPIYFFDQNKENIQNIFDHLESFNKLNKYKELNTKYNSCSVINT